MLYRDCLFFYHQILEKQKAYFSSEDCTISVKTFPEKGIWEISTKLVEKSMLTKEMRQRGSFHWQKQGAYLFLDPEDSSVYLKQKIAPMQRFLPFKYLMRDFIDVALEWKEIFCR
jgi:hypothetical protein